MKTFLKYIALIIFIIVFDQWTKYLIHTSFRLGEAISVIDGFFNLAYARNTGAAFSFGSEYVDWQRYIVLLILPVVACLGLCYALYKSIKKSTVLLSVTYSLILGGAVGNLIDRFRLGYVIDFLDFYYKDWHFATFNIADSAISVAAAFLIIDALISKKNEKKNASRNINI
jgi:signal peptidase II